MKYSARETVKGRIAGAFGMTSKAAGMRVDNLWTRLWIMWENLWKACA